MAKEQTYDDAVKATAAAKESRNAKKAELQAFEKANGLKGLNKDHSEDPKHGKAWSKINKELKTLRAAVKTAEENEKALKPAKTREATKYEYPEGVVSALDKKKYRAQQRANAKRAEKGEAPAKAPKAEKSAKAEKENIKEAGKIKATNVEVAEVKSDKKKKKKAVPAED